MSGAWHKQSLAQVVVQGTWYAIWVLIKVHGRIPLVKRDLRLGYRQWYEQSRFYGQMGDAGMAYWPISDSSLWHMLRCDSNPCNQVATGPGLMVAVEEWVSQSISQSTSKKESYRWKTEMRRVWSRKCLHAIIPLWIPPHTRECYTEMG